MNAIDRVVHGRIVLSDQVIDDGFVAVANGKIAQVGQGEGPGAAIVENYRDCLVLPGAIDGQVHSRSQKGQEDFIWSTRSAAAGGVTTIVDMPYDDGELICTGERLSRKAQTAAQQARVDFALYATLHPSSNGREVQELVEAGACAFKFSTFGTHPERFPRIPPQQLYRFFSAIAPTGLAAGVHNENDEIVRAAIAAVEASGVTDYRAHGASRPAISETLAMAEVYEIGLATSCPTHVVHCSLGRGYELCAAYQKQGAHASIEACIHYLVLDEENDVARLGGFAKINPPIRPRAEVESLWGHVAAGNVTIVSTDHVSWSRDRKSDPIMLNNSSGVPGLEAMYPLLIKGLEERSLPFTHAAILLARNPARHFRLFEKGALDVGCDADIAVMKRAPHRYRAAASGHNVVDWSPYDGIEMPWRVEATYLRGHKVFDGRDVLAEPGTGRFTTPASGLAPRKAALGAAA
ncbi:MAG: dihydroorotase family protein [Methylobacteriaceae bacterium]|nr:dihydroorotase family protein [Methylobacteriaceae bacterium]